MHALVYPVGLVTVQESATDSWKGMSWKLFAYLDGLLWNVHARRRGCLGCIINRRK